MPLLTQIQSLTQKAYHRVTQTRTHETQRLVFMCLTQRLVFLCLTQRLVFMCLTQRLVFLCLTQTSLTPCKDKVVATRVIVIVFSIFVSTPFWGVNCFRFEPAAVAKANLYKIWYSAR